MNSSRRYNDLVFELNSVIFSDICRKILFDIVSMISAKQACINYTSNDNDGYNYKYNGIDSDKDNDSSNDKNDDDNKS